MSEPSGGTEIVDVQVDEALTPGATGGGTWRVSGHGLATVAGLELRQRVRSRKWLVVLALWFALIGALTLLIRWTASLDGGGASDDSTGRLVFGVIVFLVLSLGGLVAPALSATSINGDRSAGVLAILQTTLLTPAEIVLGKLLAAWSIALSLLVVASPFLLWGLADGGTSPGAVAGTLTLLGLTLLVVCAIGLGWSALTARTSTSAVLTYLTVAGLGLGLPLMFVLTLPMVRQTEDVPMRQGDSSGVCRETTERMDRYHTERTWWLLAASPYVVVADATPTREGADTTSEDSPLGAIHYGMREVRLGPEPVLNWCSDMTGTRARREAGDALSPTWPWGLGVDLALGGVFVVAAVRRLRTPIRTLPSGTRVA